MELGPLINTDGTLILKDETILEIQRMRIAGLHSLIRHKSIEPALREISVLLVSISGAPTCTSPKKSALREISVLLVLISGAPTCTSQKKSALREISVLLVFISGSILFLNDISFPLDLLDRPEVDQIPDSFSCDPQIVNQLCFVFGGNRRHRL